MRLSAEAHATEMQRTSAATIHAFFMKKLLLVRISFERDGLITPVRFNDIVGQKWQISTRKQ